MNTIRVVLLEMRPMLRAIVSDAITREADMELLTPEVPADAMLKDLRPDVLLCGAADPFDMHRPRALLRQMPQVRVVMMAHSGRQAVVFEMRPTRLALREVSMQSVLDVIRQSPLDDHDRALAAGSNAGQVQGLPYRHHGRLAWREKP